MRNIAFSLLVTTFTVLIGLGWGLDWLYSHYIKTDKNTDTSAYESIGRQLATSIDHLTNYEAYLKDWNSSDFSHVSLLKREDVSMPDALLNKLTSGEALVLQSSDNLAIYYYLPKLNLIMLFSPLELQSLNHGNPGSQVLTLIFYAGVLAFLLLWLYPLISRLAMMTRLTQQLGKGDLSVRMRPSALSYTQTIEKEFNRMAVSIDNLVADNKLLSSAVSHDLRTPLSRIRFGVDTLSETHDQSEKEQYIKHLNDDIDEMESLIEVLLGYSKMTHNNIVAEKSIIDFGQLVLGCVKQAYDADTRLEYIKPLVAINIKGVEKHLKMLVNNLIQNALRYGNNRVLITVASGECNDHSGLTLAVEDDGPGIPEGERSQVLKPFVRNHHTKVTNQGHGMGLAIVDRVVQLHEGRINIEDSIDLGGAKVTVMLP